MRTPANTPVTPPNFPDALAALAKMSTSDGNSSMTTQMTTQSTRQNSVTSATHSTVVSNAHWHTY